MRFRPGSTPLGCSRAHAAAPWTLHWFREKHWNPAVRAAGFATVDNEGKSKPTRSPYSLRHTYASWAIAAGIGLFELSRLMGTGVEQIDRTYGHLLPDSLDRARTALDSFTRRETEEAQHGR
jgi:integrase